MKEDMNAISAYAGHNLQAETKKFNTEGGDCVALVKGSKSLSAQSLNAMNYEAVIQDTPGKSSIFRTDTRDDAYAAFKNKIFEKGIASYMEPIEVELGTVKVYALLTMESIYFNNIMDCCMAMALEDSSTLYWAFYHRNVSFDALDRQSFEQQIDALYQEMASAIGEVPALN